MTASPDDAAGSDIPLRRSGGPAAPSFPGTPGRRRPEEAPMPAEHDETIRLASAAPSGPPAPTGQRPVVGPPTEGEPDDTRPVGREWLHGASEPETPATSADWGTQTLQLPGTATPTLLAD